MSVKKLSIIYTESEVREVCTGEEVFIFSNAIIDRLLRHLSERLCDEPHFTEEVHKYMFLYQYYMKKMELFFLVNSGKLVQSRILSVQYSSKRKYNSEREEAIFDLTENDLLKISLTTILRFLKLMVIKMCSHLKFYVKDAGNRELFNKLCDNLVSEKLLSYYFDDCYPRHEIGFIYESEIIILVFTLWKDN